MDRLTEEESEEETIPYEESSNDETIMDEIEEYIMRLFIFIEVRRVFGALIKIKPKKEDLLYIEISNYILLFYSLFYSFAFLFIYFLLSDSCL